MTAIEMKNKMVEFIRTHPGATFVELKRLCGEEANGDLAMELKPNWILWQGVSDVFVDAVELLRQDKQVEVSEANVLTYAIDGVMLNLPLVKSNRQYKKPHWMPISFSVKREGPLVDKLKKVLDRKTKEVLAVPNKHDVPKTVDDTTYKARRKAFLDACDKDD